MIIFDAGKIAKLNEAIARGFIIKSIDGDGIPRYSLTGQGMAQWFRENPVQAMAAARRFQNG